MSFSYHRSKCFTFQNNQGSYVILPWKLSIRSISLKNWVVYNGAWYTVFSRSFLRYCPPYFWDMVTLQHIYPTNQLGCLANMPQGILLSLLLQLVLESCITHPRFYLLALRNSTMIYAEYYSMDRKNCQVKKWLLEASLCCNRWRQLFSLTKGKWSEW